MAGRRRLVRLAGVAWAAPTSLLGLGLAALAWLAGARPRARWRRGVLEVLLQTHHADLHASACAAGNVPDEACADARSQARRARHQRQARRARRLADRLPFAAITLGHVVLSLDGAQQRRWRGHERMHVAQAERWGPFFVPAYLASSAWVAMRGGDPWRDNAFERPPIRRDAVRAERRTAAAASATPRAGQSLLSSGPLMRQEDPS